MLLDDASFQCHELEMRDQTNHEQQERHVWTTLAFSAISLRCETKRIQNRNGNDMRLDNTSFLCYKLEMRD